MKVLIDQRYIDWFRARVADNYLRRATRLANVSSAKQKTDGCTGSTRDDVEYIEQQIHLMQATR